MSRYFPSRLSLTRGYIAPAEFIPVAEEEDLIIQLSEWVIKSVVQQQRIWHKNGLAPTAVSVNLSGLHFRQRNIASISSHSSMNRVETRGILNWN